MLAKVKSRGDVKTFREDFKVAEVMPDGTVLDPFFETTMGPAHNNQFTVFLLTKRGVPAETAYREVARQLGVKRSQVTDCGRKDAYAVTVQQIVVEGEYTPNFHFYQGSGDDRREMYLQYAGAAAAPLVPGGHAGNRFSILVRTDAAYPAEGDEFLNLFGEQRFGDGRYQVGKFLLEGDYAAALEQMESSPMNGRELHQIAYHQDLDPMHAMLHPDFRHVLDFKVQQWQSHLWNVRAQQLLYTPHDAKLPMWDPEHAKEYEHLWKLPEIDGQPVINKEFEPYLHHFARPVWVRAMNHIITEHEEGFLHEFTLRSGAFATVFMSSLYDMTDVSRENFRE